ncbi:tetratricopeptide repeat protein [Polaribacter glomeratus]|uniref:Uncharacterized protein n=1 Tax=Polaribacter glomeratus TaxID=102 RepID=A0A2S7WFX2_9FLAO|nr:hypothetical protein [Polaribacter glomeratus]PQJ76497.1 hypothetical protein BTO16_11365 [Polaribacter glomeratus]TXD64206.1 hypothetical protein ESX12_15960 [Polaribacter glomeratus]
MPSTRITLEEGKKLLDEFDNAFKKFYQNSDEHLKISTERTNTKTHKFYGQASKDVKEFVDKDGFSNSWIWSLFIDEQLKKNKVRRRYFNNTYLNYIEKLIVFYQDHIFIKYDSEKKVIFKKIDENRKLYEVTKTSDFVEENRLYENHQKFIDEKKGIEIEKINSIIYYKAFGFIVVSLFIFMYFLNTEWNNQKVEKNLKPIESKKDIENVTLGINGNMSCYFPKSRKYKIIIVPFKRQITLNKINKDIGAIIEERLNKINNRDSLNIEIHYCSNFIYDKKASDGDEHNYYKRIMNEFNADHIIYGSTKDISNEVNLDLTKIRLNYHTNTKEKIQSSLDCNNQYNYKLTTLSDLFNGKLLEDIEYLIYWNSVISAFGNDKYIQAIKYSDFILDSLNRSNPEIFKIKALSYYFLDQNNKAINNLDHIIKTYPNYDKISDIYNTRAFFKFRNYDSSAILDLNEALKTDKDSFSGIYSNMGYYYREIDKDDKKVIESYDKAIELAESDRLKAYIINNKQFFLFEKGRYYEALELSEKAIKLVPNGYCFWLNKGTNLFALGRIYEAMEAINHSISLNPDYHLSYVWKGEVLEYQGFSTDAIFFAQKSMDISPSFRAYDFLITKYMNLNKFSNALNLTSQALKMEANNIYILFDKLLVYQRMKDCNIEIEELSKTINKISPTINVILDHNFNFVTIFPEFDSLSNKTPNYRRIVIPKKFEDISIEEIKDLIDNGTYHEIKEN